MSLSEKECVPCRGGIPPLARHEAKELLRQIPQWTLDADAARLQRTFKFENFAEALGFVDRIGAIAEAQKHHPDICFGWGYCGVTLYTHKIKGLHENDFILAAKYDEVYAQIGETASVVRHSVWNLSDYWHE